MKHGAKKVIYAALVANLLISVTKFGAAWWTGSSAMLSEGVHSLVDTGNQVLLLYGMYRATLPPDEQFPFGHGKEVYFWSFVVAILIFSLGAGISLYEGVIHLMHPSPLESPLVNYIVLVSAICFEGASWYAAFKEFGKEKGTGLSFLEAIRRGKDPTLFLVLLEDSAAMLGLLVALVGVFLTQMTHNPLFDGSASILIGLILGGTACLVAKETKGLLVGESADSEVVQAIRDIVSKGRCVEHVNEVLTLHMGPEYIVATMSLDFADDFPAGEVERAVVEMEDAIKARVPEVKKVFIEAEAWRRAG